MRYPSHIPSTRQDGCCTASHLQATFPRLQGCFLRDAMLCMGKFRGFLHLALDSQANLVKKIWNEM